MSAYHATTTQLTVRYGATTALMGVSLELQPGAITGLLGRNGSGKSTLLATLAGFRRPASGSVAVDGRDPYEDAQAMAGTCLVRESGDYGDLTVRQALSLVSNVRSTFSEELAERLLTRFGVPRRGKVSSLSRGQRSAFGAAVGLASRAPLTLFDEVYLGMDAPTRYVFYEELLADYAAHPRTIVLSSHLIGEVESLFEHVLVLEEGRLLASESADTLRERGVRVVGASESVERFVEGLTVIARQQLGRTTAVTLYGELDGAARRRAAEAGLQLEHVSIQDLVVHLTRERPAEGATATRLRELA